MSSLSSAKTLLEADATLLATATGGIYDLSELGRDGLSRSNPQASSAFASDGKVKPCLVIKLRTSVPFGEIADDPAQLMSARDMLEVWAYTEATFATIDTMLGRVYTLLHGKPVGGFVCRWAMDGPQARDDDLDSFVQRADYAVVYLKQ